jgi:ElaB/YqjD/DUF883 family membrane-anchored ribosome-binding protein
MTSKIQKENKMLVDKLNQYVKQETDKLVHDVSQLRQDNDKEIHLVRNNIKELANNLDEKINRHVKSSKVNHEMLHKEVISEMSTVKQETDPFRQDVIKKNQEVQN